MRATGDSAVKIGNLAQGSSWGGVGPHKSRPPVLVVRVWYSRWKRLFDLAFCLVVMPIALPLMAICALAIWLEDPAPPIFRQLRTGKGGKRFVMYKFRTMVRNAEELKAELAAMNQLGWPDFKIAVDPRVTHVGRFLRRTSLDELPQLFNVLRGDMSIVGPRPTSFVYSAYELWQCERLEVLPGITGLWQVRGRSDLDFEDRVRLDIEYIENRSISLDIQILWETMGALLSRRGAY